jgi:hypothetical protein
MRCCMCNPPCLGSTSEFHKTVTVRGCCLPQAAEAAAAATSSGQPHGVELEAELGQESMRPKAQLQSEQRTGRPQSPRQASERAKHQTSPTLLARKLQIPMRNPPLHSSRAPAAAEQDDTQAKSLELVRLQ